MIGGSVGLGVDPSTRSPLSIFDRLLLCRENLISAPAFLVNGRHSLGRVVWDIPMNGESAVVAAGAIRARVRGKQVSVVLVEMVGAHGFSVSYQKDILT
jgi:hypothetical protein